MLVNEQKEKQKLVQRALIFYMGEEGGTTLGGDSLLYTLLLFPLSFTVNMTVTVISKGNFINLLPSILHHIREADFVAFDTELTGLTTGSASKYFYYDDIPERYRKLRDSATNFGILQFGLSAWKASTSGDRFTSTSWSFHLFPAVSTTASDYRRWMLQLGSILFLREHGFDFNRTFLDGISYLSAKEEADWRVKQESKRSDREFSLGEEDVLFLDETTALVQRWMDDPGSAGATAGQALELPPCNSFQRLLLYQSLPKTFGENLLISRMDGGALRLQLTTPAERERAETESKAELERTLNEAIGFRRIIDYIVRQGKPLVGHNCWLDLCHAWNKFVGPLPGEWADFRHSFADHFGRTLFDTKLMATQLMARGILGRTAAGSGGGEGAQVSDAKDSRPATNGNGRNPACNSIGGTSLEQLATAVDDPAIWGVRVRVDGGKTKNRAKQSFHDAGFDAYCTGKVFLGLVTLLAREHSVTGGQMLKLLLCGDDTPLARERSLYVNRLFMMSSDYDAHGVSLSVPMTKGGAVEEGPSMSTGASLETTSAGTNGNRDELSPQSHPDRGHLWVLSELGPAVGAANVNEALVRAGLERSAIVQHWMDPRTVFIELKGRGDLPSNVSRTITLKDREDRVTHLALRPYVEWKATCGGTPRTDSPSSIKRLRISQDTD